MIIVSKSAFLKYPPGTIYSEYTPHFMIGLFVKGDTIGIDYSTINLVGAIDYVNTGDLFDKIAKMENGGSVPMDFDALQRDGSFASDKQYAILEVKDVEMLLQKLRESYTKAYFAGRDDHIRGEK
jgi:hypothetical protein